jgi:hypothetical protein
VRFSLNGDDKPLWTQNGVKGTVYAGVSVSHGASVEMTFADTLFEYEPPANHTAILVGREVL